MIPGVTAQEVPKGGVGVSDPIIFQSSFDGADGATTATDVSSLHASMTFFDTAKLSNAQHLPGLTSSLHCSAVDDAVIVPHNSIYDHLGDGDFTVELSVWIASWALSPYHLAGVWNGPWGSSPGNTVWRVVLDSVRVYLQTWQLVGSTVTAIQYSVTHGMLTGTWYHLALCRGAPYLRTFLQGGMLDKRIFQGPIYVPPGVTAGLTIGGSESRATGMDGYIQSVRISKTAYYIDDAGFAVPPALFPSALFPGAMIETDAIGSPLIDFGQIITSLVSDVDTFYSPRLSLSPSLVSDPESFFAPTVIRNPGIFNLGTLSGQVGVTSAAPPLPGSRTNGNILLAFVQTTTGGKTFSIGGGWTLGDTTAAGNAAWAWRAIDGTEAAPVFSWIGAATWHGQVMQIRFANASPIGGHTFNSGAGTVLSVGHVTTTRNPNMVVGILLANGNQVIPLPASFLTEAQFNDANASDRVCSDSTVIGGANSPDISVTISSATWAGFQIEIKGL